jgi:hypothetical protein
MTGCHLLSEDAVSVEVAFVSPKGTHQLTDLSLISGKDVFSRPYLDAGKKKSITLEPGPADDRRLTVLYTLDGIRKSWTGPQVTTGRGYRIELTIDDGGDVAYRHCMRPCRLD